MSKICPFMSTSSLGFTTPTILSEIRCLKEKCMVWISIPEQTCDIYYSDETFKKTQISDQSYCKLIGKSIE